MKGLFVDMNKTSIALEDNQYLINGTIYNDTEIVNIITKWCVDNFIFRANDVLMPERPSTLFDKSVLSAHEDLDLPKFINKFGSVSLKYLVYNIFLIGFESGKETSNNNLNETFLNQISEFSDEVTVNHKVMEEKNDNSSNSDASSSDHYTMEKSNASEISELFNESENSHEVLEEKNNNLPDSETEKNDHYTMENPINAENSSVEKSYIEALKDDDGNLVIDSNTYAMGTYSKFICLVIERKLSAYGMEVSDLNENKVPSFLLDDLIYEIDTQDAINSQQEMIRDEFKKFIKLKK
jgi:hypothetical protein